MARPKTIRAPTAASLPNNLRIPSTTPSLVKTFGKLSRTALLDLALEWLDDRNVHVFPPYLESDQVGEDSDDDDETNPYAAAQTVDEVRSAYRELQDRKGAKREVIDRILEGDWRHGITLRQLAMADMRYLDDHSSRLRWTALELTRIGTETEGSENTGDLSACLPRIHASTFLKNLQREISPLVKAHYYLARSASLPLVFLRIFVTDSPYQYPRQSPETFTDASKVIYVAFPDTCPFIYTSLASSTRSTKAASAAMTDGRSLRRIVGDAIPKALSRPHERYTLKATALTAKSLSALLALRGPGRSNAANGAFSIFADAVVEGSPLDPRPSNTVSPEEFIDEQQRTGSNTRNGSKKDETIPDDSSTRERESHRKSTTRTKKPNTRPAVLDETDTVSKKRKLAVYSRFGTSGTLSSAPLDRLDIRMLDLPNVENEVPSLVDHDEDNNNNSDSPPVISLTFSGTDVVSGIRKLAELGIVDPERMPSWMTGEEGVSVAAIRNGKRIFRDSTG